MEKQAARQPVVNPRNMSKTARLLLALGAYREAMGEDAHAEEGDQHPHQVRS